MYAKSYNMKCVKIAHHIVSDKIVIRMPAQNKSVNKSTEEQNLIGILGSLYFCIVVGKKTTRDWKHMRWIIAHLAHTNTYISFQDKMSIICQRYANVSCHQQRIGFAHHTPGCLDLAGSMIAIYDWFVNNSLVLNRNKFEAAMFVRVPSFEIITRAVEAP